MTIDYIKLYQEIFGILAFILGCIFIIFSLKGNKEVSYNFF